MEAPNTCEGSLWKHVNSASDLMPTCVIHKQCMCSKSIHNEDIVVAELGNTVSELLHIQDVPQTEASGELNSKQIHPSTGTIEKVFAKSATFPCSRNLANHVPTIRNNEIPDMACAGVCSTKSDKPACTRSISLPNSLKPVSAMKGSRERQGVDERVMAVTWAPDVYDPPVTSASHTVKGYSQLRYRTTKRSSKHKHKGKSSRGSGEKKQYKKQSGKSKTDITKNESIHASSINFLDLSAGGQESNCGSSFLRTSVGKVHIPFAEAT